MSVEECGKLETTKSAIDDLSIARQQKQYSCLTLPSPQSAELVQLEYSGFCQYHCIVWSADTHEGGSGKCPLRDLLFDRRVVGLHPCSQVLSAYLHVVHHLLHLCLLSIHHLEGWPRLAICWHRWGLAAAGVCLFVTEPVGELRAVFCTLQIR